MYMTITTTTVLSTFVGYLLAPDITYNFIDVNSFNTH